MKRQPLDDTFTFSLHAYPWLARGLSASVWDSTLTHETVYLIIHIDATTKLATGIRLPWFMFPKVALANLFREAKLRLRLLPHRTRLRATCTLRGHQFVHTTTTTTDDPGNRQPCVTTIHHECRRCGKRTETPAQDTP